MTKYEEKVIDYLREKSIAQTKDLKKLGLSSTQIQNMVNKNLMKRVRRGLYSLPNSLDDPYYELQLKYTKLIFSHETALSLHNMTDVTPSTISGTVPRDYNYQHIVNKEGINVVRVNKERYDLGIEQIMSPFGNKVTVTNRERTLCDVLLKRNHVDTRILNEAFKNYFSSSKKNLNTLMKYAKVFKVDKLVRTYMEVLL